MQTNLEGRSVLVTGGSSGIGAATARAFAAEGARVALTYRSGRDAAERLAAEMGADRGRAMAVRCPLEEPAAAELAVQEVGERWGGIDVFVANAVRWAPRRPPDVRFEEVPPAEWEGFVADNLVRTLRLTQLVLPGMRARGWGRIVLLSSHVVHDGQRGQEFYGAVKGALHGLARSLAWDVGPDGVLVNVVCPGLTTTDRVLGGLPAHIRDGELARTATARLSSPQDVAAAVLYLGSAANGNVTGQVVTVAGGR
ncbi:SDR family NAD(P)-dependent oxidoreductase [Dactylosporangium sp. NPDC000555]|uniref:SDR family NAD(P)-dependent oxidoreductase n=1 Tax=Dactylosporangium sp. NPDC000555 TaxID=3154260 RepID=UPI00331DB9A2